MAGVIREWAIRVTLVLTSSLLALVLAEVLVRIVYPINDGRANVTLQGKPLTKNGLEPSIVYRQVSNEYDALTTITNKGHRVPGVEGNPDVVFLGDSFTYGWGLSDDEAFASIYCRERHRACANLGRPGTGTAAQIDRLEQFLDDWHWRPKEVKLFFFGMSGSFSAGNDFVDNYFEGRAQTPTARVTASHPPSGQQASRAPAGQQPAEEPMFGLVERVIGLQGFLLQRSNLIRIAKYHAGPYLKSLIVADPGERLTESLLYTDRSLKRLDDLSRRAGFTYNIYLLVPVQDIIRGTYPDTLATLNRVSPKPVISTAPLFLESPRKFYYAYDGHINSLGSRRIAEFLVSLDARTSSSRLPTAGAP